MSRPLLLDLFSGAGGAAVGYYRAGFDVVGVDHQPQPRYPFRFIQADALEPPVDLSRFDLIHASPPCQAFTAYKRRPDHVGDSPDLIDATRRILGDSGRPWVIENVPGAPLQGPALLCGSMFGLDVRRHRLFESDPPVLMTPPCDHASQAPRFPPATNRTNLRRTVEVGVWRIPLETQQDAMGVDWMTREELSESIPPAYTEYLGRQLLRVVSAA